MSDKVLRLHAATDMRFENGFMKPGDEFAVRADRIISAAKCDIGTAIVLDRMFVVVVKESYGCIVEEMERQR